MFLIANFMGNSKEKKFNAKKKPFDPLTVRILSSDLADCEVFWGKFGEKHYGNRVFFLFFYFFFIFFMQITPYKALEATVV